MAGVAGVELSPCYERNGLYGRLVLLAVDGPWQNRGIGRALVAEAEAWAVAEGATWMSIAAGTEPALIGSIGAADTRTPAFASRSGFEAVTRGLRFVGVSWIGVCSRWRQS